MSGSVEILAKLCLVEENNPNASPYIVTMTPYQCCVIFDSIWFNDDYIVPRKEDRWGDPVYKGYVLNQFIFTYPSKKTQNTGNPDIVSLAITYYDYNEFFHIEEDDDNGGGDVVVIKKLARAVSSEPTLHTLTLTANQLQQASGEAIWMDRIYVKQIVHTRHLYQGDKTNEKCIKIPIEINEVSKRIPQDYNYQQDTIAKYFDGVSINTFDLSREDLENINEDDFAYDFLSQLKNNGQTNSLASLDFSSGFANRDEDGCLNNFEGMVNTNYGGILNHFEGRENTVAAYEIERLYDRSAMNHLEGYNNYLSDGYYNHLEGCQNNCNLHSQGCHLEGVSNQIYNGYACHTEGYDTTCENNSGNEYQIMYAHAEGCSTFAGANYAHAEGNNSRAIGTYSHTEGYSTNASGEASHAEGYSTNASYSYSHAEGYGTQANGYHSHAEGDSTIASGDGSHAGGCYTTASNFASHVCGKYNAAMTTGGDYGNRTGTAFVVGNGVGSSTSNKTNAFSVQYDGTTKAMGTITASTTADYAEMFEWQDGNPNAEDRVGHFVTIDGDKVKIASAEDDYILGVVSGAPFVLGNGDCDVWNGMFIRDDFNRIIREPAPKIFINPDNNNEEEYVFDENDNQIFEGETFKLNPEFDDSQIYISRRDRAEWTSIGMLGVLAVIDDGNCQVNGYCTVGAGGIAIPASRGENTWRVIKRVSDNVIQIIFK